MSTKEKITELVERIQDGAQELMPELWEAVERLAAWQANRIVSKLPPSAGVTFEDLYNSGYIALDNAVKRYDREVGEFIGLFMLCLRSAFAEASGARSSKAMKDPLRQIETRSTDEFLPGCDDMTLADTVADDRDDYEAVEERIFHEQLHNELEKALQAIPEQESDTLRRRYYARETLKKVGEDLGIGSERVRQIEIKALRHLREPSISGPLRQFIEEQTPYYYHVGAQRFNTTHTSSTEHIAMMRETLEEYYGKRKNGELNSLSI